MKRLVRWLAEKRYSRAGAVAVAAVAMEVADGHWGHALIVAVIAGFCIVLIEEVADEG